MRERGWEWTAAAGSAPFSFLSPAAGKELEALGERLSRVEGRSRDCGDRAGRGREGVCLSVRRLCCFPSPGPSFLCFSSPASSWCGRGLFVCERVCVCACASLCAASSTEGGVSAPPSPLCLLPVWSGQEGYEGNGDPLALLPQSFLSPVSSLSSGKCQNT